jgi:uncharacterized protein (TIGR03435 family)
MGLAALCAGVLSLSIRPSTAQTTTAVLKAPVLEVVSVKQVKDSGGWQSVGLTADGLNVTDAQLWLVIRTAFGAEFFGSNQIVGEPSWSHSEHYDIQGKVNNADVGRLRDLNQAQQTQMTQAMLQAVLAERFQMKVHQEDREAPIYALIVAKNGSKLKEATEAGADSLNVERGQIIGHSLSLQELAKGLTGGNTGRVVVDRTGLTGKYDFTLTWTPDQGAAPPGPDGGATENVPGPSIFTAIQEQLGLKLEPAKGPVKTLVIDHIERPSAN